MPVEMPANQMMNHPNELAVSARKMDMVPTEVSIAEPTRTFLET